MSEYLEDVQALRRLRRRAKEILLAENLEVLGSAGNDQAVEVTRFTEHHYRISLASDSLASVDVWPSTGRHRYRRGLRRPYPRPLTYWVESFRDLDWAWDRLASRSAAEAK